MLELLFCLCYVIYMKKFFNKKRIAFLSIVGASFIILIVLLIFPIGSAGEGFNVYSVYDNEIVFCDHPPQDYMLTSPFTLGVKSIRLYILIEQTIVFTFVGIVFIVFLALLLVELKKAGAFNRTHRHTKTECMQAQIDDLQKQVDELKKDK